MHSNLLKILKWPQKISFPKNKTKSTVQWNAEFCADYKCADTGFKCSGKKLETKTMRIWSYPDIAFYSMLLPKKMVKHFFGIGYVDMPFLHCTSTGGL